MAESGVRAAWAARFAWTMTEEIRSGVRAGALTWAEGDELLARMHVLVDQALDLTPQYG